MSDTYSYYIKKISGHHYCFKENIISNQWFKILYHYSLKLPEVKVHARNCVKTIKFPSTKIMTLNHHNYLNLSVQS